MLARFNLPFRIGQDTGVVIDGVVDPAWHLVRVDFAGGQLWTRDSGIAVGGRVRAPMLARDVSLATERSSASSIQNVLSCRRDAIVDDEHPGIALVRVHVGDTVFLARVTKKSLHELGLSVGDNAWVQVKSVALLA